jgi:hypothetical protein
MVGRPVIMRSWLKWLVITVVLQAMVWLFHFERWRTHLGNMMPSDYPIANAFMFTVMWLAFCGVILWFPFQRAGARLQPPASGASLLWSQLAKVSAYCVLPVIALADLRFPSYNRAVPFMELVFLLPLVGLILLNFVKLVRTGEWPR